MPSLPGLTIEAQVADLADAVLLRHTMRQVKTSMAQSRKLLRPTAVISARLGAEDVVRS